MQATAGYVNPTEADPRGARTTGVHPTGRLGTRMVASGPPAVTVVASVAVKVAAVVAVERVGHRARS